MRPGIFLQQGSREVLLDLQGWPKSERYLFLLLYDVSNTKYARETVVLLVLWHINEQEYVIQLFLLSEC